MPSVGTPVVRRIVGVSRSPIPHDRLLADLGLSIEPEVPWTGQSVAADAYYDLLERVAVPDDPELPFRYGASITADSLGALGLAMKTAPTVADSLRRLMRYVLVLSDTLDYELLDDRGGCTFTLVGRPHHRPGAALANECALAAVVSMIRQATGSPLSPRSVSFRHRPPADDAPHRDYFGCPVRFDAHTDGVSLDAEQLRRPTLLADDGLSSYLLAQLDDLRARVADRSLVTIVRGVVADTLADGQPSKSDVARRLGMSERTLHRRLADDGANFQTLVTEARRDAAESLLGSGGHSLADVAFLTGFSDQTAFTRAFKRWTGLTPAEFRRRNTADG